MKNLNFNWIIYKENIGILGQQGEGKTSFAKKVLDTIPNTPRFIWSPQRPLENYAGYGTPINKIEDVHRGFYIWNGDYSRKTFIQIISRIFHKMKNLVVVIDDVHEQCTKQMIPEEFEHYILSGRNRGLCSIFLSPFPNRVHNTILGSCQHMTAFRFDLVSQIEWMRNNFFGDEAWLLLSKDKRRAGMFTSENDYDLLPPHSYIYRKNTDMKNQIMIYGVDFN